MAGMCVLVVGGGGREHAICLGLSKSDSVNEIHCAPGNAGTSHIATNHNFTDVSDLTHLAFQLDVDLVIVGPEAPLCEGLADMLINCLLYTSDAADEGLGVDLGGRRIIKKKIKEGSVEVVGVFVF